MYNKKRSPFDPSLEPTASSSSSDPWIWGNQRGGGGAPLRDMDGNHLANLKKVLHGEVDVDHSPVSGMKGPSSVRRLSPRGQGQGQGGGDGYGGGVSHSHVAATTKKKISFQEVDPRGGGGGGVKDRDRSSRRSKNDYSYDDGDDSYDEQQSSRQSIMRRDRTRDDRETQQQQYRPQQQGSSIPGLEHVPSSSSSTFSPPKKFMSAVSDMHSGAGGSSDRDMKMRYCTCVGGTPLPDTVSPPPTHRIVSYA